MAQRPFCAFPINPSQVLHTTPPPPPPHTHTHSRLGHFRKRQRFSFRVTQSSSSGTPGISLSNSLVRTVVPAPQVFEQSDQSDHSENSQVWFTESETETNCYESSLLHTRNTRHTDSLLCHFQLHELSQGLVSKVITQAEEYM